MINEEYRKKIMRQMQQNESLILRLKVQNIAYKLELGLPPFDGRICGNYECSTATVDDILGINAIEGSGE